MKLTMDANGRPRYAMECEPGEAMTAWQIAAWLFTAAVKREPQRQPDKEAGG